MEVTFASPKRRDPDTLSPESKRLRARIVAVFGEYPGKFCVKESTKQEDEKMRKRFVELFGGPPVAMTRTEHKSGAVLSKNLFGLKQVNSETCSVRHKFDRPSGVDKSKQTSFSKPAVERIHSPSKRSDKLPEDIRQTTSAGKSRDKQNATQDYGKTLKRFVELFGESLVADGEECTDHTSETTVRKNSFGSRQANYETPAIQHKVDMIQKENLLKIHPHKNPKPNSLLQRVKRKETETKPKQASLSKLEVQKINPPSECSDKLKGINQVVYPGKSCVKQNTTQNEKKHFVELFAEPSVAKKRKCTDHKATVQFGSKHVNAETSAIQRRFNKPSGHDMLQKKNRNETKSQRSVLWQADARETEAKPKQACSSNPAVRKIYPWSKYSDKFPKDVPVIDPGKCSVNQNDKIQAEGLSPESKKLRARIVAAFGEYPGKFCVRQSTKQDDEKMKRADHKSEVTAQENLFGSKQVNSETCAIQRKFDRASGVDRMQPQRNPPLQQVKARETEAKPRQTSLSKPAVHKIHPPSKCSDKLSEDIMETICQRKSYKMPFRPAKRTNAGFTPKLLEVAPQRNPESRSVFQRVNAREAEVEPKQTSLSNPAVQKIHSPSKFSDKLPDDFNRIIYPGKCCVKQNTTEN
ncbi:hypothetical protein Trydic_g23926, partial [Trypoxylus dichotomus]